MSNTSQAASWLSALTALTVLVWAPLRSEQTTQPASAQPAGWSVASHGDQARPDYERLFSTDAVHDIRIVIPPDRFEAMQTDLRSLMPALPRFGGPGANVGVAGAPPFPAGGNPFEAAITACTKQQEGAACSIGDVAGRCTAAGPGPLICVPPNGPNLFAGRGGRGGPGRGMNFSARDPIYVPVTVQFDGRTWPQVGMRYKGNSSLMFAIGSGNGKVPFRLDFDRYEKEHPEVRNQRFYGFNELTFSSNTGDDSQIREAFATEVFRDRGVPAARAAFYRVSVDTGSGPEYWGLYTMIEDPSDGPMLEAQFGSRTGTLYKPDGSGATWTEFDRESFPKKSNEDSADFGDIEGAIRALHAPRTDPRAWRAELESRFDVELFLRWLAVNSAIENWDAYGVMPHNYYLYGDPAQKGRLRWIPWDHNFSFGARPFLVPGGRGFMGGALPLGAPGALPAPPNTAAGPGAGPFPFTPPGRGGPFPGLFGGGGDVLHAQVGSEWPLIQLLLSDDVYAARYREQLQHALGGLLAIEAATARMRELHALVAPAALGERPGYSTLSSREGFEQALDGPGGLVEFVKGRHQAVRTALTGNGPR